MPNNFDHQAEACSHCGILYNALNTFSYTSSHCGAFLCSHSTFGLCSPWSLPCPPSSLQSSPSCFPEVPLLSLFSPAPTCERWPRPVLMLSYSHVVAKVQTHQLARLFDLGEVISLSACCSAFPSVSSRENSKAAWTQSEGLPETHPSRGILDLKSFAFWEHSVSGLQPQLGVPLEHLPGSNFPGVPRL